jgi:hypothetical protein
MKLDYVRAALTGFADRQAKRDKVRREKVAYQRVWSWHKRAKNERFSAGVKNGGSGEHRNADCC